LWKINETKPDLSSKPERTYKFLSFSEKEWIKKHKGTIRLAPDPDFAPFEFYDDQGQYVGMGADYFNLLEQKTGLQFEIAVLSLCGSALKDLWI